MRKASDLMSLLAQRGSARRRSGSGGWSQWWASVVRPLLGRRQSLVAPRRSAVSTAGLGLFAVALGCVGAGYVLGNVAPWSAASGGVGLQTPHETPGNRGVAPGPIEPDDLKPLSSRFFLTACYPEFLDAKAAVRGLRQNGVATAGLTELPTQARKLYGLVVYFDGDRDRDGVRRTLMTVTSPDSVFDHYRKTQAGWPLEHGIR